MPEYYPGQRWISEAESEYGIGTILAVENRTVSVLYQSVLKTRIYALQNAPLARVHFKAGESIRNTDGITICIESITADDNQLLTYQGKGNNGQYHSIKETDIDHYLPIHNPTSRLLSGQLDDPRWFTLRLRAREYSTMIFHSNARGLQGARISLIPHQLYIADQVARQHQARALLADEVGLGKTIEACLILHRRITQGLCQRAIVIVPQPLINQWLVELLRRFNLSFSIFDEKYCQNLENHDQDNPFLQTQLVLCTLELLKRPERLKQALEAGWDLMIVDEAHHLHWMPENTSLEYQIVEQLSQHIQSILLLTATPERLGQTAHFARLRLLDPQRFNNIEQFLEEQQAFEPVADLIETVLATSTINEPIRRQLLNYGIDSPADNHATSRQRIAHQLIDLHGTSRLLFRNTRETIQGFPERQLFTYALTYDGSLPTKFNTAIYETLLDNDPRITWLIQQIRQLRPEKCLLICSYAETALALEDILLRRQGIRCAVFHENLSIIQRDRAAAWFAEENGAEILLCSEIGSEGRNFQFAHHLILFDLPLNPDLLEQRIGRLDRIGQHEKVHIHVPTIKNSTQAMLLDWYQQVTHTFQKPDPVATQVFNEFYDTIMATPAKHKDDRVQTSARRAQQLRKYMEHGRDRLLSLSSFNKEVADEIVKDITTSDNNGTLQPFMDQVFDLFGIDSEYHSPYREVITTGHHAISQFPFLKTEDTLITYDRPTALIHEDTQFLTWDHPMVTGAIDTVTSGSFGTACLHLVHHDTIRSGTSLLELLYCVDCPAPPERSVKRHIARPTLRLLLDDKGRDIAAGLPHEQLIKTANQIDRTVAQQAINSQASEIRKLIEGSRDLAQSHLVSTIQDATESIHTDINEALQRLTVLRQRNPDILQSELTSLQKQRDAMLEVLKNASIKLDAIRLIVISD